MQRMLLVMIAGAVIVYVASRDSKPVAAKPTVVRSATVQPAWIPPPPSAHDDAVEVDVDEDAEDTGDSIDQDIDVELDTEAAIDVDVALDIARAASQLPGTGMIMGVIRDEKTGESLAGATVVATSPSLEGAQVVITDENGFYKLSGLPAGLYRVTLYYLETTVERSDIVVGRDRVTPVYAKLSQPTYQPMIQPEPGVTIDTEYVRNIPTTRYFENPDDPRYVDDAVGISISGSISGVESNQNTYIVDGVDTTLEVEQ